MFFLPLLLLPPSHFILFFLYSLPSSPTLSLSFSLSTSSSPSLARFPLSPILFFLPLSLFPLSLIFFLHFFLLSPSAAPMWLGMEPPKLRDAVGAPRMSPCRWRVPELAFFTAAMAELPGAPVVSAMSSPSWPMQPVSGKSSCCSSTSIGSSGKSYTTGDEAHQIG